MSGSLSASLWDPQSSLRHSIAPAALNTRARRMLQWGALSLVGIMVLAGIGFESMAVADDPHLHRALLVG
jgi:hypothetical protein